MIRAASFLIELIGSVVIVAFCLRGLVLAVLERKPYRVHDALAQGVLWGLDFKLAATLLKTLELTSWHQIAMFVLVLGLRTLLKRSLTRAWSRRLAADNETPAR